MAKIPKDCMPKCEGCNAGVFEPGDEVGECHLLPMQWVTLGEQNAVPMWAPARRDGWCRHFERKVH